MVFRKRKVMTEFRMAVKKRNPSSWKCSSEGLDTMDETFETVAGCNCQTFQCCATECCFLCLMQYNATW